MSAKSKNTKEFTTEYTYELSQMFKIYYGSYSDNAVDVNNGLIGEFGPFFYTNHFLMNIQEYWRTSYMEDQLIKFDSVKLEYLFDEYTNVNEIKDRINGGEKGKIEGDAAEYSGKGGISIKTGTQIVIPTKITTSYKFTNTLCYFFGFQFEEPLTDDFKLFGRGDAGSKHSLFINLRKVKEERFVVLRVIYITSSQSPETMEFKMKAPILPSTYNELQVCFTIAQDFFSSGMAYLNGQVEYFDVVKQMGFNYDEYSHKNVILDKEASFKGSIEIVSFIIVEGGGGVLNSQQTHPEMVETCRKTCLLQTNDLVMSSKCIICLKINNNVNDLETKICQKNCRLNHKNLRGFCAKCSESNCAETDMPKMNIEKGNKYYTKFKITPSKKLWKEIEDWPKRLSTKVTDMKEGKDYDIKYHVESKTSFFFNLIIYKPVFANVM